MCTASTGLVLVRCCQHRPSTGPVLAHIQDASYVVEIKTFLSAKHKFRLENRVYQKLGYKKIMLNTNFVTKIVLNTIFTMNLYVHVIRTNFVRKIVISINFV